MRPISSLTNYLQRDKRSAGSVESFKAGSAGGDPATAGVAEGLRKIDQEAKKKLYKIELEQQVGQYSLKSNPKQILERNEIRKRESDKDDSRWLNIGFLYSIVMRSSAQISSSKELCDTFTSPSYPE